MGEATQAGDEFLDSAELYDAIYSFKDYAKECERLRAIINVAAPGAKTLLDVACGTGSHSQFLKKYFKVDGIDRNEDYLRAARRKNPAGHYRRADMTGFDLGATYHAITCLFSAIGYVGTVERLGRAIAVMARHLAPGGVLIVEPWLTPDRWQIGTQTINGGELSDGKVVRLALSGREGNLSVIALHYLRSNQTSIRHYVERMELGLFTRDEMTRAFTDAALDLDVRYDDKGLIGRGLYIARLRS